MSSPPFGPRGEDLEWLEADVRRALETGDESALTVLGYGEISTVLLLRSESRAFACKRLPRFSTMEQFDAYEALFHRYLTALSERGVIPVQSALRAVKDGGGCVGYCVQSLLEPSALGPKALAAATDEEADAMLDAVVSATVRCASAQVGLDAQLSNWVWSDGALRYLDVTTPMLRDEQGRDLLDTAIFLASLPAALRPIVRAFVVRGILDRYHSPRPALRDLVANLYKERLERHVPRLLARINGVVTPEMTAEEAREDYRADAGMWAILQRLRRADRWWQRAVRRRAYPFLLPGSIER